MEQLHSVTFTGATGISNFTAPQWQEDSIMVHRNAILNLSQSIAKFNGIWQRPLWRSQFNMRMGP